MKKQPTLVSVGMPVYNGEKYLSCAISSLLTQTHKNFELIISDNASTDKTKEICLKYARKDKRIKYYQNKENMGPVWNFNRVFNLAKSKYFMWASHDDYWKKDYLQACLKILNLSKKNILAGSQCRLISPKTEKLLFVDKGLSTFKLNSLERFIKYKLFLHESKNINAIFYGIYRRRALCRVMPFKRILAADHVLLLKLCFQGSFITVPKVLMTKRFGGASKSCKKTAEVAGIKNKFLIKYPWLIREILAQKIIFQSTKLNLWGKIKLSGWSWQNYVRRLANNYLGYFIKKPLIKHR